MARNPFSRVNQQETLLQSLYFKTEERLELTKRRILTENSRLIGGIQGVQPKTYYKGRYYTLGTKAYPGKRIELHSSLEQEMDIYIEDLRDYEQEYQVISAYFTSALNLIEQVHHLYDLFPDNLKVDMPIQWFNINYNVNSLDAARIVAEFKDNTSPRTLKFITDRLLTNLISSK